MRKFSLGLFLLAAGTLMYEIVLTRLLSVISWYYLAFVSVSMAMFGMTAGALAVQLRPAQFTAEKTPQHLARAVFAMAVALPLVLMTMLAVPIEISYTLQTLYAFLLFSAIIAVPFFFSGVAICLALTRTPYPIGRVYFVDLAGAAAGCFAAVALLYLVDGPSAVLAIAALLFASAASFAAHAQLPRIRAQAFIGAVALLLAAAANSATHHGIQPMWTKGNLDRRVGILAEIWNPISKVRASQPGSGAPWMWGPSPRMPEFNVRSIGLNIDNDASTPITEFTGDPRQLEFLEWDVTSIAPQLRPGGAVAVIGVGGGRDILNAHANGARRIVGIEINSAMVELSARRLRDFSGLAKIPGLELHVDEGRSYLTRTTEQFDVIQASLVDTWAATSAGAVTLSENALYTVEGWQTFYRRLRPGGLLTFSRWNQGEAQHQTMRLFALAWATLLAEGVAAPHERLALISSPQVATLLLSNQPLAPADLQQLRAIAAQKQFSILFLPSNESVIPGPDPDSSGFGARNLSSRSAFASSDPMFSVIASRRTLAQMRGLRYGSFDVSPVFDSSPFFFNAMRLRDVVRSPRAFTMDSNIRAIAVLLCFLFAALVLVTVTILLPMWRSRAAGIQPALSSLAAQELSVIPSEARNPSAAPFGAVAYFVSIGLGFMLAEIAMMQQLSLFLGHPIYSLVIVLAGLILFTGVGALASERWPLTSPRAALPASVIPPALSAVEGSEARNPSSVDLLPRAPALAAGLAVALISLLIVPLIHRFTGLGLTGRALVALAIVAPCGFVMGYCFPVGLRWLTHLGHTAHLPWMWALNGAASVLAAFMAILISMEWSILTCMRVGAACYFIAAVSIPAFSHARAAALHQVAPSAAASSD